MKNFKLSIIFALALIVTISSCKKKEEDPKPTTPTLKSFSFPTTTDLEVEMSWTVNGQAAGNNYVDLDLDIYSGTTGATYSGIEGSSSSSGFESLTLYKSASNYTGTIGVNYYGNETGLSTLTSPYTIVYTIKVYPTGNVAAAQTYTGTIVNPTTLPSYDILYNQLSIVKNSTTYSFNELSPKTTFDYSTIPDALLRATSRK